MISLSQTQQWHAIQFQHIKLNKNLQKCLSGRPSVHLQRCRSTNDSNKEQTRFKTVHCRAGLAEDAPFAIAIGTCVLNSIVFPPRDKLNDQDGESMEDVRYAAMGIIGFIPYFNWLSWVFAWLDTGRRRYLVYAIVYLAPYISVPVACIGYFGSFTEISLKSGELQDFQLFGDASMFFSENGGGRRLQKQLGSLLQKLQASKVEHYAPSVEEETKMDLEEWNKKMESLLEDRLPRDETALGERKDIKKTRNELGKKDDSDSS